MQVCNVLFWNPFWFFSFGTNIRHYQTMCPSQAWHSLWRNSCMIFCCINIPVLRALHILLDCFLDISASLQSLDLFKIWIIIKLYIFLFPPPVQFLSSCYHHYLLIPPVHLFFCFFYQRNELGREKMWFFCLIFFYILLRAASLTMFAVYSSLCIREFKKNEIHVKQWKQIQTLKKSL